jgi:hypothetical protein
MLFPGIAAPGKHRRQYQHSKDKRANAFYSVNFHYTTPRFCNPVPAYNLPFIKCLIPKVI